MKSIIKNTIKVAAILTLTSAITSCSKNDDYCPEKYVEVYQSNGQVSVVIDANEPLTLNSGQQKVYKDCEVKNVELHAITDVKIRFNGEIFEMKAGDIKDLK